MDTLTAKEVFVAIRNHFGGNDWLTQQGFLSFIDEFGEEEDTYPASALEEWLAR